MAADSTKERFSGFARRYPVAIGRQDAAAVAFAIG
jgi:hypothetical protein